MLVVPNLVVGVVLQLVSESVKIKQAQSFLLSEKQALANQLHQVNSALESLKLRIADSEEQVQFLSGYGAQTLWTRQIGYCINYYCLSIFGSCARSTCYVVS